jgi:hypothetical protein
VTIKRCCSLPAQMIRGSLNVPSATEISVERAHRHRPERLSPIEKFVEWDTILDRPEGT